MIQVGDVIKLRPSVFDEEFQNKSFDWSAKYLYEDCFSFVSLRFKGLKQPGDMAKIIFGSSETIVDEIESSYNGQPFIVLTSNFRIIYPSALETKEIISYPFVQDNFKSIQEKGKLINDLEFLEQTHLEGLFSVMERENNKLDKYRIGLFMMIREGKWKNAH